MIFKFTIYKIDISQIHNLQQLSFAKILKYGGKESRSIVGCNDRTCIAQ